MKSGLKTLGMWLIIAVIFIVLLTTIMDNSSTKMNYSELVTKIEASEVKEIEITSDATKAYVTLKGDSVKKEVNIPSIDSFMNYIEEPLTLGQISLKEQNESIFITLLVLK